MGSEVFETPAGLKSTQSTAATLLLDNEPAETSD